MFQLFTSTIRLTVCLLFLLWAGCTTVMIETGKKAFEDRTTEDQVTDAKITTGILSRFSDKDKGLLLDVSADVWEQRVLLTGTLDSPCSSRRSITARERRHSYQTSPMMKFKLLVLQKKNVVGNKQKNTRQTIPKELAKLSMIFGLPQRLKPN